MLRRVSPCGVRLCVLFVRVWSGGLKRAVKGIRKVPKNKMFFFFPTLLSDSKDLMEPSLFLGQRVVMKHE